MRRTIVALSLISTLAGLTACNENQEISSAVIHQQHIKAADAFSDAARVLGSAVGEVCQAQTEKTLAASRSAWQVLMQDWMVFQGREKGSEQALALAWQIQFWPDKKDITGRKMEQLLAQDTKWTAELLAEQSVAVQGLGAMEWLLYANPDKLSQPDACALATAVSQRLIDSGEALAEAWKANPWQAMTPQLALGEYVGALTNQLDFALKKLTLPMGKPGHPRPYQAESWRSQTSMNNLKANVQAMQSLYLADGKGLDALLRAQGEAALADRIAGQFNSLIAGWPQSASMGELLKTRDGYRELISIFNGMEYLHFALHDEVSPALGIVVGFNATDGD
ncbi:imelysin family protein [Photobacterium sp. WH77]|uniref:imelysin family protein n=1 Tax=unclassified Photobacterium TaxID=2628852 RepID=UPI001EDA8C7E|nr:MULTISPECIES: imelysin family protein [unclassified Photobacterium]MCG2838502.1 imelysin family protein [Photobacterium sp. WH77]MCG2846126.1 imelysin family protein [Photobacterium sp. WH80]